MNQYYYPQDAGHASGTGSAAGQYGQYEHAGHSSSGHTNGFPRYESYQPQEYHGGSYQDSNSSTYAYPGSFADYEGSHPTTEHKMKHRKDRDLDGNKKERTKEFVHKRKKSHDKKDQYRDDPEGTTELHMVEMAEVIEETTGEKAARKKSSKHGGQRRWLDWTQSASHPQFDDGEKLGA